jgi:hypothetical protein
MYITYNTYFMNPYTKTNFGNSRIKLLHPPSANKITRTTPAYFCNFFWEIFFFKYIFLKFQKNIQKYL